MKSRGGLVLEDSSHFPYILIDDTQGSVLTCWQTLCAGKWPKEPGKPTTTAFLGPGADSDVG